MTVLSVIFFKQQPLTRGNGVSHFLIMREKQQGYSCCALIMCCIMVFSSFFQRLVLTHFFVSSSFFFLSQQRTIHLLPIASSGNKFLFFYFFFFIITQCYSSSIAIYQARACVHLEIRHELELLFMACAADGKVCRRCCKNE